MTKSCLVCRKKNISRIIDLGYHPPADSFHSINQVYAPIKLYPLACLLCNNCGHVQSKFLVPPRIRYIDTDYSYTSANSEISRKHWQEFCEDVSKTIYLRSTDHVIEFGSNDGYLLKQLLKKGVRVTGIEPSPAISDLAIKKGINTIVDFLNKKSILKAIHKKGKAKLVIGNHVLNHIDDLHEAISAIKFGLKTQGYFVFEVPYLKDMVVNFLFDMIYHEHRSYFSVKSVDTLLKKHQLFITHIVNNSYHGGSIRVFCTKIKNNYNLQLVKKYIRLEEKAKLFDPKTYALFMKKITQDKLKTLEKIYTLKKQGKRIAAIGASARGNTLINFYKLDRSTLEFVTDNSKYKLGKYTPLSSLPIVEDTQLVSKKIDAVLMLSWNIGKYLVEKIKKINKKIIFIVPGEKKLL